MSRVSSSEDEDILKVRQLCIDKSVCLVKLQAVKAIGGVGMMSELTDTKDTEELVDFISRVRVLPLSLIYSLSHTHSYTLTPYINRFREQWAVRIQCDAASP